MKLRNILALFTADKRDKRQFLHYIHIDDEGWATATNGHILIRASTILEPGIYTRSFKPAPAKTPNLPSHARIFSDTKDTNPQAAKAIFNNDTLRIDRSGLEYNIKYPNQAEPRGAVCYFEILVNNGQIVKIAFDYAIFMLQLDATITGVLSINMGLRWTIPDIDAECWTMALRV